MADVHSPTYDLSREDLAAVLTTFIRGYSPVLDPADAAGLGEALAGVVKGYFGPHRGGRRQRSGYSYGADGVGVPEAYVDAVVTRWAAMDPAGDATRTLAAVNQSRLTDISNLARHAVQGVLETLRRKDGGRSTGAS